MSCQHLGNPRDASFLHTDILLIPVLAALKCCSDACSDACSNPALVSSLAAPPFLMSMSFFSFTGITDAILKPWVSVHCHKSFLITTHWLHLIVGSPVDRKGPGVYGRALGMSRRQHACLLHSSMLSLSKTVRALYLQH